MARGRREIPPCCKTYGLPLYCAAWAPLDRISAAAEGDEAKENRKGDKEEQEATDGGGSGGGGGDLVVALGGGGGEGRSGIGNALLLSHFDFATRSLSDQPVFRLGTDKDLPYRMAMHPRGDGLICSFPKDCRWFEWDFPEGKEPNKLAQLALKSSGKILTELEDVGQQLALVFNAEGSVLAAAGEDGHLRVFKWPSMEVILDQTDAHTKDLDFSSDAKFLASIGSSGPCRVWDLTSSTVVANLPREDGENFGFCRFSQSTNNNQILFVTAMHGDNGKILSWNTQSWKKVGSKRIVRDSISAFNVSADGKLFAIGTVDGNILIMNSSDMVVLTTVKRAHLGIVTAVVFSHNSRALLTTSFDSFARVTVIEGKKKSGFNMWLAVLVILIAFLVYFIKFKGTF